MPLPSHQKLTHLQSLDPPTHQKTDIGFQSIINLKNSNSFFKWLFVIFADIEEKFKTIFHKPSLLPYTYTVSSNIYFWYFRNESWIKSIVGCGTRFICLAVEISKRAIDNSQVCLLELSCSYFKRDKHVSIFIKKIII